MHPREHADERQEPERDPCERDERREQALGVARAARGVRGEVVRDDRRADEPEDPDALDSEEEQQLDEELGLNANEAEGLVYSVV